MNNGTESGIITWFTVDRHPGAHRLFCALIYGWFVVQGILVWSVKDLIWGQNAVLMSYSVKAGLIDNLAYRLLYQPELFPAIFYGHLCCALISMFDRRWSFIPRSLTWVSGMMLFYGGIPAFNSGILLMLLLSFYSIPVYTGAQTRWRAVINRFAYMASFLQIVMCYAYSAIYKLSGTQWLQGEAVYYSLHIDRFTQPWLQGEGFLQQDWLMITLNYLALAYQVVFPIAIWFGKRRSYFLLAGVIFHLFICIVMNLWDFGLAMIFSYALFLSERQVASLRYFFTRIPSGFQQRMS
jgi:hypothetical protein